MSNLLIINEISQILLNSSDSDQALDKSMTLLSKSLEIDCLRIDKNVFNEKNEKIYIENFYLRYSDKDFLKVDSQLITDFSYDDIYEVFAKTLGIGKPLIRNNMNNLTYKKGFGNTLKNHGLKSFFMAPIFFNSNHWGNLCFWDYTQERDWEALTDELMILASLIGSFIKNSEFRELFGKELYSSHSVKMATLGEMASGIAHEINNPLFVINGYASKIDASIDRGVLDVDELSNISKMIQKNCKRVTSIISGLRLISRKSKLDELEVRNFKDVIESAIDISKERIRLADINLINNMENIGDVSIECHPEQISQVIINLLNNAHDSLVKNDENKWIELNMRELEDRVIFSLTDSGERISSDIAKKMMLPFYTTKESGKGTGLGLSISKEIISKHGGNLYFDEHCESMRFVIELPKLSYE